MRLAEIQKAIQEEKLDGWLFYDHHGRDPLSYRVLQFTPGSMCTRRWYYFIPAKGEPRGLAHKIEAKTLKDLPGVIKLYAGWIELMDGLRSMLGGARRVAMQYSPQNAVPYVSMVDAGTVELVRALKVEVVTAANLIQMFEAQWSKAQLESHLEAGRRVDRVRAEAFALVSSKVRAAERVTEFEMKEFILARFKEEGLFTDHGPDVAVNGNASNPHYDPTRESCSEIHSGDLVLMDMWAKLAAPESVYYDITWVGFCGETAPEEIRKVFGVVREARDRAIECVVRAVEEKRALCGFEVDDAARGVVNAAGYGEFFFHRTGHSIGTEVHGTGANMDNLETDDERKIIPWTCFSIEPGIYLKDFGIRSEVDVFVGEGEARVTGEMQERLLVL